MIRKYVENAKMQLKIHEIFFLEQKSLLAYLCAAFINKTVMVMKLQKYHLQQRKIFNFT